MGDGGFLMLWGGSLVIVGHWFVFVVKDRADDDEYSRALLLVARPVRLLGLIVAAGGVLWLIADAVD